LRKPSPFLVATPQFTARHGLPRTIDELRLLPAIPSIQSGAVQPWEFVSGQRMMPKGVFRTGDLEPDLSKLRF
jgi:hypothetical protein